MKTPPKKQQWQSNPGSLNALVYCLIVLAVFLGGIAAWRRYSQGRRPGGPFSEPGNAFGRQIDALMPDLGIAEGWIKTGGLPQVIPAQRRFICPQCRSLCWTHPGRGWPTCPFCGRVMVHQEPGMSLMGGAPAIGRAAVRPTLIRGFGIEICPALGAGVKVTGVMGNSYASNAGLRGGDIIIKCNGSMVHGVEQFQRLVSRAIPETDAQIRILRNGRTRDLRILVGEGEMEGFTPIQRPWPGRR